LSRFTRLAELLADFTHATLEFLTRETTYLTTIIPTPSSTPLDEDLQALIEVYHQHIRQHVLSSSVQELHRALDRTSDWLDTWITQPWTEKQEHLNDKIRRIIRIVFYRERSSSDDSTPLIQEEALEPRILTLWTRTCRITSWLYTFSCDLVRNSKFPYVCLGLAGAAALVHFTRQGILTAKVPNETVMMTIIRLLARVFESRRQIPARLTTSGAVGTPTIYETIAGLRATPLIEEATSTVNLPVRVV
jgi:hypothetical protein